MSEQQRPFLSICVPTYNRADSLKNLLQSLVKSKEQLGSDIEICVSNNCSTDETASVIDEYRDRLVMNIVTQSKNIGGTLNILEVAKISTGEWGIWIGDDDEIDTNRLRELMECLKAISPETWILVDAGNVNGEAQYFTGIQGGKYTGKEFRSILLRKGLNAYGFMGVHVFPSCALPLLEKLNIQNSQPWPHMAGMLRFASIESNQVKVISRPLIRQAGGGDKLFWTGGDLARLRLAKIRILRHLRKDGRWRWFTVVLMVRELYSFTSWKALFAWKLYENDDFQKSGLQTYWHSYGHFSVLSFLVLPHLIIVLTLLALPKRIYRGVFSLIGKGELLSRYLALKNELGMFDGMKRGI